MTASVCMTQTRQHARSSCRWCDCPLLLLDCIVIALACSASCLSMRKTRNKPSEQAPRLSEYTGVGRAAEQAHTCSVMKPTPSTSASACPNTCRSMQRTCKLRAGNERKQKRCIPEASWSGNQPALGLPQHGQHSATRAYLERDARAEADHAAEPQVAQQRPSQVCQPVDHPVGVQATGAPPVAAHTATAPSQLRNPMRDCLTERLSARRKSCPHRLPTA